ncbi:hypothetical protein VTK56DRAFT_6918 [Thermocarpiscus australiensis]
MVRNMVYEQVTDVIRPKVLGSMHLDRIFHDVDLDFFVLLSSINCVIGNVGQANYAAANMGMCGVAAARRRRGLVSSVANVGAIIGVGYITQSARQLDLTVANTHLTHLSEEDFHQIFAEAMEAGYLDSPDGPEISTGLLEIWPDTPNMPKWYSDPKFARLIVSKTTDGGKGKEKASAASILDSLKACRSEEDVFQVVKSAFAAQLRRILQISTGDGDMMNMRSIDLGLDSLISVGIRSWFLKNLQVSIPVLKIMANDAQMSGLVEAAVEGIPAELIPEVRADAWPTARETTRTAAPRPTRSPPRRARQTDRCPTRRGHHPVAPLRPRAFPASTGKPRPVRQSYRLRRWAPSPRTRPRESSSSPDALGCWATTSSTRSQPSRRSRKSSASPCGNSPTGWPRASSPLPATASSTTKATSVLRGSGSRRSKRPPSSTRPTPSSTTAPTRPTSSTTRPCATATSALRNSSSGCACAA